MTAFPSPADGPLELGRHLRAALSGFGQAALVNALDQRSQQVRLYEMREIHGTFQLKRAPLDTVDLSHNYPRRAADATAGFEDLDAL